MAKMCGWLVEHKKASGMPSQGGLLHYEQENMMDHDDLLMRGEISKALWNVVWIFLLRIIALKRTGFLDTL